MPIFEYRCRACARPYESLVQRASAPAPSCPHCGAADAERLPSAFAVVGPKSDPPPGPCGSSDCACRSS